MNAFEISTAVAERLPIRVFVFNDECLGMVEHGHESVYGRSLAYPTTPLDVAAIARGLGATALRVERLEQLAAASELLRTTAGPIVVDVRLHPKIRIPRQDRVATMNPGVLRARAPSE